MPANSSDLIKNALEVVATVAVAAIGVAAIAYSRRVARERAESTTPLSLMQEFQRAYDAGEMDEEEFRRVRDSLTGRQRKEPIAREIQAPEAENPPEN
jgi:uncharacterized membrane protein